MSLLEKVKQIEFNTMGWDWQDDDTVRITLTKDNDNKVYHFLVKHPHSDGEEILEELIIRSRENEKLDT